MKQRYRALRIAKIVTRIPLYKYQMHIRKNWNKVFSDSDQKNDENNEMDLDIDDKNMW